MGKKTKAVFLGAGASAALGYPVTAQILPKIREKLASGKLLSESSDGKNYRKALASGFKTMFPGWERPGIEPPPITDILSLVDYARISSITQGIGKSPTQMTQFRRLLEFAICEVINDVYDDGSPEKLRERFVDWLLEDSRRMGLITTNYDIEVEMGIFHEFERKGKEIAQHIDFGYAWRETEGGALYPRPIDPLMRIFKLHGSLNCLRCDLCEHTYINLDGPIDVLALDEEAAREPENSCDCGHHVLSLVLVAPSLVRDIRNVDLLQTWKNALEWLRQASHWYIIGYSFPQEDLAIRSMFMRAYQGRWDSDSKEPQVTVVQRGRDAALESRYKVLFPNCKWITGGLAEFVKTQGY
jgi:NAD-dependent SIR2 family protein deacetylase